MARALLTRYNCIWLVNYGTCKSMLFSAEYSSFLLTNIKDPTKTKLHKLLQCHNILATWSKIFQICILDKKCIMDIDIEYSYCCIIFTNFLNPLKTPLTLQLSLVSTLTLDITTISSFYFNLDITTISSFYFNKVIINIVIKSHLFLSVLL
jgi:hypothetical protein